MFYIVDTNSISPSITGDNIFISEAQIGTKEVKGNHKFQVIKIDEDIFRRVTEITSKYKGIRDRLFSLIKNQGSADPFIIASAKYLNERGCQCIVITNDTGMQKICTKEEVKWTSREDYLERKTN